MLEASWGEVGQVSAHLLNYWIDLFRKSGGWKDMKGTVLFDDEPKLSPLFLLLGSMKTLQMLGLLEDVNDGIIFHGVNGVCEKFFFLGKGRKESASSSAFLLPLPVDAPDFWEFCYFWLDLRLVMTLALPLALESARDG